MPDQGWEEETQGFQIPIEKLGTAKTKNSDKYIKADCTYFQKPVMVHEPKIMLLADISEPVRL